MGGGGLCLQTDETFINPVYDLTNGGAHGETKTLSTELELELESEISRSPRPFYNRIIEWIDSDYRLVCSNKMQTTHLHRASDHESFRNSKR